MGHDMLLHVCSLPWGRRLHELAAFQHPELGLEAPDPQPQDSRNMLPLDLAQQASTLHVRPSAQQAARGWQAGSNLCSPWGL